MISRHIRQQLPKARWITFKLSRGPGYFARFRLANAWQLQLGRLTVMVRAPYLEHVARVHYPHLFERRP